MALMASPNALPAASAPPCAPSPIAPAMRCRRRSRTTDSACALKSITAGRNMALRVPWCRRGSTPPRLWLSECTHPRPF